MNDAVSDGRIYPDEVFTPEEYAEYENRKAFASMFDLSKWPEKLPGKNV